MSIHGTLDYFRPYEYGLNGYYLTLDELNSYWSDRNGFSGDPKTESYTVSGLTVELKQFGETIHHYKVIGGDHIWLDISNNGFSTNQLIWNFFTKFDLNGLR